MNRSLSKLAPVLGATLAAAAMSAPAQADLLYSEDFTGQNGQGNFSGSTDTSLVDWTVSAPGVAGGDTFGVVGELFRGTDVNSPSVWTSPVIDITGFTDLTYSLSYGGIGTDFESTSSRFSPLDYFDIEYILDGGDRVNLERITAEGSFPNGTLTYAIPEADTLQVVVELRTNSQDETLYFDNIEVNGVIPEPASLALLCAGTGPLVMRRRA